MRRGWREAPWITEMLSTSLVVGTSFAYLMLLFAVAYFGDWRARQGRSIIGNPWTYALSMAVYCTAWTYFGSVGRAATSGVWFLPIYLGPTLAMVLAWTVVRKMIRIAKVYRITSIADFIASRYGKSPLLAGSVTLITVVGIVPYIALQLKAISGGYALLTTPPGAPLALVGDWWRDSTLYIALVLAGFTMVFGARHLDSAERHEGMVAAIAFESVVKLAAFLAVGAFVTYSMFDGLGDIFERVKAVPALQQSPEPGAGPPVCVHAVVRAHRAVDAVGDLFAAAVPGDGGGERRRKPPAPRGVGVSAVHAADQRVRAADRARRAAVLRRGHQQHRRQLRAVAAACARAQRACAGRVHRRFVGGDRHGDRRGHRGIDDGVQRPRDAAAAAHAALRRACGRAT